VQVHAGGEALVDEAARELFTALVIGDGREHEDEISHGELDNFAFGSCTLKCGVVLFLRVPKDETQPTPKRRTSKLKRPVARGRRIVHWLLLFVASVIVVDGLVGDRGLLAMLRARQEYDELARTIAQERAENARLRDEARRLKEDPKAIEEIARRDLGLIRPGERVFIIKDVPPPSK
jgi:cell division protein FtsB